MLKKIINVRNVGRFVSSALPGVQACAKYTQVFGGNGYGKTTLCSVLRSLATNDPGIIIGRTRVGAPKGATPEVQLLFDSGAVKFENGAWSAPVPEIIVFDGAFIADNVHSGDAVDLEQKRNLYRVIVGKEGVGLAVEEEQLAAESRAKGSDIKIAERAIQSHVPQGMILDIFVGLPADPDIDAKIAAQTTTLAAVREADQLKARPALSEISLPPFPGDFSALLSKTLEDIGDDAQKRIAAHVKAHRMHERGEAWLAEGVEYITDNTCPFCGQYINYLGLIDAYRKVFAQEYRRMTEQLAGVRTVIDRDFGDRAAGALDTLLESNRGGAEFWGRYCKLPELRAPTGAPKAMVAVREEAAKLLSRKAAAPQEAVHIDADYETARRQYDAIRKTVDAYNVAVRADESTLFPKTNTATPAFEIISVR